MMAGLDGRPTWRSSTIALPLLLLLLWLGVYEGGVQHTTAVGFWSRWFRRSNRQRAPSSTVVQEQPMDEAPVWLVMRVERRRFYHWLRRFSRPKFEFDRQMPVGGYRVLRMTCYALKASARQNNYDARVRNVSSCYDEAVKYARQNGSRSVPIYTYEVAERNVPQLVGVSLRDKIAAAPGGGGTTTDANVAADFGPQNAGDGATFVGCQTKSGLDPANWNCLGTKDGVPFQPALADQYEEQLPSSPQDADDEEPDGLPRSRASDLTFKMGRRVETADAASLHGNATADAKVLWPFLPSTAETSRKTRVVVVKLRDEWQMGHFRNGFPRYKKTVTKKRLPKGGTHVTLECYIGVNMFAIPGCFGNVLNEMIQTLFPQEDDNRENTRIFITAMNLENLRAFMFAHHNPKYNYVFEGTWRDEILSEPDTVPDDYRPFLRAPLAASLWGTYILVNARHTDVLFFQRNAEGREIQFATARCAALFTAHFNSTWWELRKYAPRQSIEASTETEDQEHLVAAELLGKGDVQLDVSLAGSKIRSTRRNRRLDHVVTFHIRMKENAEQEYEGKLKDIQPTMQGCSSSFQDVIYPALLQYKLIHIKVIKGEALSLRNTKIHNCRKRNHHQTTSPSGCATM